MTFYQGRSFYHKIGFLTLLILAFLRPIISTFDNFGVGFIHHFLVVFFSYFLVMMLFLVFKDFFREFDATGALIIFFSFYVCLTFLWGTKYEDFIRCLAPFVVFFAARVFLNTPKMVMVVVLAFLLGYILPIIGSLYFNLTGLSTQTVEYYSEVERNAGMYSNFHKAAHSMGLFSVFFGFFLIHKDNFGQILKYALFALFIVSIYIVWHTYVRSAYVGILIFWCVFLYFYDMKYLGILLLGAVPIFIIKIDTLLNIFFKTKKLEMTLEGASSGRTFLWEHNLSLFLKRPFYEKFLGSGLGSESLKVIGGADEAWSSHNDWISLLMTVGIVGMLVYAGILISFLGTVLKSKTDSKIKGFFIGIVLLFFSTTVMTNYYGRIEVSQSFWFILGCFYAFEMKNKKI